MISIATPEVPQTITGHVKPHKNGNLIAIYSIFWSNVDKRLYKLLTTFS